MTILFLALLPLAVGRDVVVVGGGMAGIAAARKLQQNGHKVTLLEARDRMGGRVWTSTSLGFPTDLGASWIHGANAQNPLTPFVSEFSIYTEDHPDEQNCRSLARVWYTWCSVATPRTWYPCGGSKVGPCPPHTRILHMHSCYLLLVPSFPPCGGDVGVLASPPVVVGVGPYMPYMAWLPWRTRIL